SSRARSGGPPPVAIIFAGAEPKIHENVVPPMWKDVLRQYWADRPMDLAAALSYYTLLSLAPLVLMTVALAGLVFERATVERRIVGEMRGLIGAHRSGVTQARL